MGDPLNQSRQLLTWLSFVGIHVFLLSFPMLTYPQEEEVGFLNLEASTRNILNKNSWSIFEIWPTLIAIDGYDKLQLIAELHIEICF